MVGLIGIYMNNFIRKRCFYYLLYVLILLISYFPDVISSEYKTGWTETFLKMLTDDCASGILNSNIDAYKRKANYTGKDIPKKLKEIIPTWEKEFTIMCRCLSEYAAKKWSFFEYTTISQEEKHKMISEAFCTNECKPALDAPIDCREYEKTKQKNEKE